MKIIHLAVLLMFFAFASVFAAVIFEEKGLQIAVYPSVAIGIIFAVACLIVTLFFHDRVDGWR